MKDVIVRREKAGQAGGLRSLIIEDDPTLVMLVRQILKKYSDLSHHIESAKTIEEATSLLSSQHFDIAILDLNLPDSSGIESLKSIVKQAPNMVVIVLTGMDSEELGIEAMKCGAQDFLIKGNYDNTLLVRSIRHSLERHRLLQKLKRLAVLDELTGLYNRRGFYNLANEDLSNSRTNKHTAFILYFDTDGFKTINDQYGHDTGDRVLQWIGTTLISIFRQQDIIARLGGDEFVVMGIMKKEEEFQTVQTRLQNTLDEQRHPFEFDVFLSYGHKLIRHNEDLSIEKALRIADERLYAAKKINKEARAK